MEPRKSPKYSELQQQPQQSNRSNQRRHRRLRRNNEDQNQLAGQSEIALYQAFCPTNRIALDGEAGEKNGALFAEVIGVKMDSDFTPETLETAFLQLKSQLELVSETYKKADELARNLSPQEQEIYRAWAKNQKLLIGIDGSEEGYRNVSTLLGWMRGNAVTAHSLDLALGNCVNNAQFGRIHFHPQPKQDRSIGPGGKINHALVNKSEEGFAPRSSTNRSIRQIMEENRPKGETVPTPVSVNVEFKSKAEALQGRSHGQTAQAMRMFVVVPGTSDIDWAQTYRAREKFLTAQTPLIRR